MTRAHTIVVILWPSESSDLNQLNIYVRIWSDVSDCALFFPFKRFDTFAERVTSRIQSLLEAHGYTTP